MFCFLFCFPKSWSSFALAVAPEVREGGDILPTEKKIYVKKIKKAPKPSRLGQRVITEEFLLTGHKIDEEMALWVLGEVCPN